MLTVDYFIQSSLLSRCFHILDFTYFSCIIIRLSRRWKVPILLATLTYLAVQLPMVYIHIFTEPPTCRSPKFSHWTWKINFFGTSSYFVYLIILICHVAIKYTTGDEMGSYAISFYVSFLAGISSLIHLCTEWTGICEDAFGVRFSEVYWAEWIVCVPLIHYAVLATDIKFKLSQADAVILALITMAFMFGICLQFSDSFPVSVLLLVSAFACYIIGYIYFYYVTIFKQESSIRTHCESLQGNEYQKHLKKSQVQLAACLIILLPLFPIVYLMSLFRVINHDITFTLFSFLNVTVKLIFCSVMNSSHRNVTNEITRHRLVAESLAEVAENAANESRRLFVRYIMHEVRVPLSSITLGLGYLEQCPDMNDDEAKEALLMMEGATGFMTQTLNDVLNVQKIEEGNVLLDFYPFSIKRSLYRVKASLQRIINENQNNVIITIHPDVPEQVVGDAARVEHVILNLVSNALKCSKPQADVAINVTVAVADSDSVPTNHHTANDHSTYSTKANCERLKNNGKLPAILNKSPISNSINFVRQKSWATAVSTPCTTTTVIFSVTDKGPGISESDMKILFLPFSQIQPHELQSGAGSGVGLVICKQIVELHGWTISCQSTLGVGTTITFSIPFEVVEVSDKINGKKDEKKGSAEFHSSEKTFHIRISDENSSCNLDDEISQRPASKVVHTNDCLLSPPTLPSSYRNIIAPTTGTAACTTELRIGTNHSCFSNNYNNNSNSNRSKQKYPATLANNRIISPRNDRPPMKRLHSGTSTVTAGSSRFPFSRSPSHDSKNDSDYEMNAKRDDDEEEVSAHLILPPSRSVSRQCVIECPNNECSDKKETNGIKSNFQSFSLPALISSITETVAAAPVAIATEISKVLIVDDVSSNRRILAMLLRQRGITSTMAANGLEGVKAVKAALLSFDLVFMDNSMPIMNGVEATRQLRAIGFPNLIIGVTGNAMEEDVREFLEAGADSVILKPATVLQIDQILVHAKTYGNNHISNNKIIFTDTDSYSISL